MNRCRLARTACMIALLCIVAQISSSAQDLSTLFTFDGTNGADVPGALIQGTDGNFYGLTENKGAVSGTAFKIKPDGTLITLYNFCSQTNCTDGEHPIGSLLQTVNGNLYGATLYGGANDGGEIFQMTPSGVLKVIYSFCSLANCADGSAPLAGVVLGLNGNLYGTTSYGGAEQNGTIFELTPEGKLTTLYSFCASGDFPCPDGANPYTPLMLASNGNFYGTTYNGGAQSSGVVFEISPAGRFATLYSFCTQFNCVDGANPYSGLIQASDGNLYGTTYYGGANCNGGGCGTIYKITMAGDFTSLYSFCSETNCGDGLNPIAGVVQGTDGDFYGTAYAGGRNTSVCVDGTSSCGVVYRFTPAGTFTTLYSFCSQTDCSDGGNPKGSVLQATNGAFYGSTFFEGDERCQGGVGCGTIFGSSLGLRAFVVPNPGFGRVGQVVNILGNNLAGSTGVAFNGTPAQFKVVSNSYIKAEVPSGATTGTVEVATVRGTLTSNVAFYILP